MLTLVSAVVELILPTTVLEVLYALLLVNAVVLVKLPTPALVVVYALERLAVFVSVVLLVTVCVNELIVVVDDIVFAEVVYIAV